MSAKTAHEKRDKLLRNPNVLYILDAASAVYHAKTCPHVSEITKNNLVGLTAWPSQKKYFACPICLQEPVESESVRHAPMPPARDFHRYSKRQVFERGLQNLCNRYALHLSFVGNCVHIASIAGEWYFDFTQTPIDLHHRSNMLRLDHAGQPRYYHKQNIAPATPVEAIAYIYRHELATERRLMAQANPPALNILVQERLQALGYSQKEFLNQAGISASTWRRYRRDSFMKTPLGKLAAIADALELDLNEVVASARQRAE